MDYSYRYLVLSFLLVRRNSRLMRISIVYASGKNGEIGRQGKLPWHDKEELKFFSQLTQFNIVVMGYNTWVSLNKKPLKHRINVIINHRDKYLEFHIPDIDVVSKYYPFDMKPETLLSIIVTHLKKSIAVDRLEMFIIGGEKTYNAFLPFTDRIYHSLSKYAYDGCDAFFKPDLSQFTTTDVKPISDNFNLIVHDRVR